MIHDTWLSGSFRAMCQKERDSQTKRGSLRGGPWRPCVITLEEGNPSLWIRG